MSPLSCIDGGEGSLSSAKTAMSDFCAPPRRGCPCATVDRSIERRRHLKVRDHPPFVTSGPARPVPTTLLSTLGISSQYPPPPSRPRSGSPPRLPRRTSSKALATMTQDEGGEPPTARCPPAKAPAGMRGTFSHVFGVARASCCTGRGNVSYRSS
jgi:hypothetical protein